MLVIPEKKMKWKDLKALCYRLFAEHRLPMAEIDSVLEDARALADWARDDPLKAEAIDLIRCLDLGERRSSFLRMQVEILYGFLQEPEPPENPAKPDREVEGSEDSGEPRTPRKRSPGPGAHSKGESPKGA